MYKVTENDLNEITNYLDSLNKIKTDRPDYAQLLRFKEKAIILSNKIKSTYTKIKAEYEEREN